MKYQKTAYTLLFIASAFLAYNAIAATKTDELNIEAPLPETKIQLDDIQPAKFDTVNREEMNVSKDENNENNKNNEETSATSDSTNTTKQLTIQENKSEVSETTENLENKEPATTELPALEKIELPAINRSAVDNKPVKIEVSSQRIPAGTILPLKLENPITSMTSSIGDQFNATLTTDVIIGDKIVLPAGSVLRGTIGKIQKASFFVREARIMLIFDHIVTPSGKQIPLYAYMAGSDNVNFEGYIVGGTSYSKAFKKDASKSKDIVVNSTNYGVEKGMAYLAGVPVVITAPVCAIGGALGGGGYIIGKSVYNMFVKGANVTLNAGTQLDITLSKALDIPVD